MQSGPDFAEIITSLLGFLCSVAVPAFLILLGVHFGRQNEKRHQEELDYREKALGHFLITDLKSFEAVVDPSARAMLVGGEASIATDYFKSFIASFIKLVGGSMFMFETLAIRARREAMMRMIEQAHQLGYNAVCNVRLDTVDLTSNSPNKMFSVSVNVIATGTAYRVQR